MTEQELNAGLEASFFNQSDYAERAASFDQMADEQEEAKHTRRAQRGIFGLVLCLGLAFAGWLQQTTDGLRDQGQPARSVASVLPSEGVEMSPRLLAVLDVDASQRNITGR